MEIVLTVTTHGEILLNPDGTAKTFTLPDGITLTKVSVSAPGVCNVTSPGDLAEIMDRIIELWKSPRNRNDWRVADARKVMAEVQRGITKEVTERRGPENPEWDAFVHHADKAQSVVKYGPGQQVVEKQFSRTAAEEKKYPHDFKILALNFPGYPDMMSTMMGKAGAGSITLSSLVNGLKNNNINHITLFDFSCSVMEAPERAIRSIRRDLLTKGINGGKSRRYKKKTKTRRTRKARI